jgi:hypothetical protein
MNRLTAFLVSMAALVTANSAPAAEIDWSRVDQAIGKKDAEQPGGIHKYGLPRSDLTVSVDGIALKPALALGSWLAFQPAGDGAMVMGDLVLLDTEISPVMKRLVDEGIEITAIHNHLLRMSVPVLYMHIEGHGDPIKLAQSLQAALSLSKTPLSQPAASQPVPLDLDTDKLEKILGLKGTANGGAAQSHDRRFAAFVLHAFLGRRRCAEARAGSARGATDPLRRPPVRA